MRHLVYTILITKNGTSCHLWSKETLVKHQKISKYYENNCPTNFILLFLSLLAPPIVKRSQIYSGIYFIFLKHALRETWRCFDIKFIPQWLDRKSSYQVNQSLATEFLQLNCPYFRLKLCEISWVTKIVKEVMFGEVWGELETKKFFRDRRLHFLLFFMSLLTAVIVKNSFI